MQCKSITKKKTQCIRNCVQGKQYCKQHLSTKPEPIDCIICCEPLDCMLYCDHPVHIDCIKKSMKPECPICKAAVTVDPETCKRMEKDLTELTEQVNEELSIAEAQRLSNEPEFDLNFINMLLPGSDDNLNGLLQMLAGLIEHVDISD